MENMEGVNMNSDLADRRETEQPKKHYHAPALITLGATQLVVRALAGHGLDANGPGGFTTSAIS
jgi:hypothetical protein